jgi:hypothetical protein
VECRAELPCAVGVQGHRLAVAEVLDVWLVEDDWWRAPVARRYVRLLLADGRPLTVFEDKIDGGWYLQQYRLRLPARP